MFFDALTAACIAAELRETILGGRVQRVLLPDSLSIGLEIYAHRQRHYLLASAHAEQGRIHLAPEKLRRGVEKTTGLLQLLRKYGRGAILSTVEQPPFERILRLELDHPQWGCSTLVVEVMGRHSNIILVDATGRVLDAVKRVGPHLSRRPILPGRPYTPPPPQSKLPPSELTEYRLRQILTAAEPEAPLWRVLVGGLRGMSPLLAREIAFRALGHPQAAVAQVERLTPLLETIAGLLAPLRDGQWQPSLALEEGRPVAYAPYPLTHRDRWQPMPSMSRAIAAYTAAVADADPYAAARRSVRAEIDTARARLERRRAALERTLREAAQAEQWRRWGESILAYAHTITPGRRELRAETDAGEEVIPLDPAKSAVENAQGYFARYRKAKRAAEEGPARLEEVDLALRDLEQLETDLALAVDRSEIDRVRTMLAEAGFIKPPRRKGPSAGSGQPLRLTSPDGLPILIGRNSRQNDTVTFRLAKGDDWWFHARGVPGAHVIVRGGGRDELPPDTIRRAAELAAYFSRRRDEAQVEVDYTRRRYVRRIRGAAPGLVTYRQEQTIRVAPRGP